jgi:hypothetical protein
LLATHPPFRDTIPPLKKKWNLLSPGTLIMIETTIDVKKFIKPDKDVVISIQDVEYLFTNESLEAMRKKKLEVPVVQLYDGRTYNFPPREIEDAFFEDGAIDYLDKK